MVSFQVYVNSFLALLNVRYYPQANAGTIDPESHTRHEVYHPELAASQDNDLQASRKNMFSYSDNEVVHPTRPARTAMVGSCIVVEWKRTE